MIYLETICDSCGSSIGDGGECYCRVCMDVDRKRIIEARDATIKELETKLKRYMELSEQQEECIGEYTVGNLAQEKTIKELRAEVETWKRNAMQYDVALKEAVELLRAHVDKRSPNEKSNHRPARNRV